MERVALPINRYPGEINPYPSNSSGLRSWKSKGNQKSWSMVPIPTLAWSWSRRPEVPFLMEWKKCRPIIPGHEVEKKEVAWKGGALEVERFFLSKFRIKMDLISSLLFALHSLSIYQSVKTEFRIWQLLMEFSFFLEVTEFFIYFRNLFQIWRNWYRREIFLFLLLAFFWLLTYTSLVGFGCQFQILNQNWSIEVLKLEVEAWVQS